MAEAPAPTETAVPATPEHRLREVVVLFVRLGVTAFGSPAAHIAMMRDSVAGRI